MRRKLTLKPHKPTHKKISSAEFEERLKRINKESITEISRPVQRRRLGEQYTKLLKHYLGETG